MRHGPAAMTTKRVIAFDVYGTLIDVAALEVCLEQPFGARAKQASRLWREKQIEYSFRRALMRRYANFDVCTRQALIYVSRQMGVRLGENRKRALLAAYLRLPAFPDVKNALRKLKERGNTLVALSNGTDKSLRAVLRHAGLNRMFEAVMSVDAIKTFKPDPAVYQHLARSLKRPKKTIWFVSSNPFDVIGAKNCGLQTVWLQRDGARILDPWQLLPDVTVRSLEKLCDVMR